MYYEMVLTYAYRRSQKAVIRSISDKSIQQLHFNVFSSLLKCIGYMIIDMAIVSLFACIFGASLFM